MVNEVVMYQSMFVLGVLMFAFFAVSFDNFSDYAESITLDNNLDRVLEEINEELLSLLDTAADQRGKTGSITLTLKLDLDAEYASESYIIQPFVSGNDVSLQALIQGEVISELPVGFKDGTDFDLRQITFSGSSQSSSDDTGIIYTWDSSTGSETVTFY